MNYKGTIIGILAATVLLLAGSPTEAKGLIKEKGKLKKLKTSRTLKTEKLFKPPSSMDLLIETMDEKVLT